MGEGRVDYNATRGLQRFSFAEELVSEALDVVQPVSDDDVFSAQQTLHGRVLGCAGLLLGARIAVDGAWDVQRLCVDQVDPQLGGRGGGGRGGDLLGEEGLELACARGLAGAGVAGDDYELRGGSVVGSVCGRAEGD